MQGLISLRILDFILSTTEATRDGGDMDGLTRANSNF